MVSQRRSRLWLPLACPFAAVALLITACGGSSSTHPSSATAPSGTHRDIVNNGPVTQRPQRGTGGSKVNDDNPGRADSGKGATTGQSDPCALVSKTRAQALVGKPIAAPQTAPLGPTCIYQSLDAKVSVAVAIESSDFASVRSLIHHMSKVTIGNHRAAYCGVYGRQTTFVPLSGKRVLTISAPCSLGFRFAAEALPALTT
jgi:hypothetical protein